MFFWIAIAASVLFALYVWRQDRETIEALFLYELFALVVCLIVLMLGAIVVYEAGDTSDYNKLSSKTTHDNIATLQDNLGTDGYIHGGLFFTYGHIGSKLFVSWYEETSPGVFEPKSVSEGDGDIYIHEVDSNADPQAIRTEYDVINKPLWNLYPWEEERGTVVSWDIYVPKGTITQGEFKLDAK